MDRLREVVLYTTHCPICMLLEKNLKDKNIPYTENNNVEEMKSLGFSSVPVLKVDNKYMMATEAIEFLNKM